ncbi:MAG: hypothetical protein WCT00_00275 [Bacilli bacterium]|jgi:hypothetical protein
MLMVLRMINVVGGQGAFWAANTFIWGWILLPVLQLGELVKRDCGENKDCIKDKTLGYFGIITIIVIFWFISIPLGKPFLKAVLLLDNNLDV